MKWFIGWVCLFSAVLAAPSQAIAEESSLDVNEYIFSDENIVGELPNMDSVSIYVRHPGKEKSLIRLKTHFVREMLKSVESM